MVLHPGEGRMIEAEMWLWSVVSFTKDGLTVLRNSRVALARKLEGSKSRQKGSHLSGQGDALRMLSSGNAKLWTPREDWWENACR